MIASIFDSFLLLSTASNNFANVSFSVLIDKSQAYLKTKLTVQSDGLKKSYHISQVLFGEL